MTSVRTQPAAPTRSSKAGAEVIAGVQRSGSELLIVAIAPPSRPGALPELRASAAVADADAAADLLLKLRVRRVVRVLPGDVVICRTTALPTQQSGPAGGPLAGLPEAWSADDRASLVRALELIAEGELPPGIPAHRRAAGIIAPGPGRAPEIGLLVGWAVAPQADRSAIEPLSSTPESWTCPLAALAGLVMTCRGVAAAAYASPAEPNATCAALAAGRTQIARSARISVAGSGAAEQARATAAARILDETCALAAGSLPAGVARSSWSGAGLHIDGPHDPEALGTLARASGQRIDQAWLDRFGIPLGAALLAADPDPALRALAGLTPGLEAERGTLLDRAAHWLLSPRNAAVLAAACLLLALGLPWLSAWARTRTLNQRISAVPDLEERVAAAEQTAAFHALLKDQRWPMTKLLADISGAAPEGVRIDSLELAHGEGVLLRGIADDSDLVTAFRENLSATRIFSEVATPSIGSRDDSIEFQLQARLTGNSALFSAPPKDDFAARPLVDRLYGEGSAALLAASPPRAPGATPARDSPAPDRATAPSRGAAARPAGAAVPPTPPPISDAEIAALDRTRAMLEWTRRQRASTQPGLDEPTKRRLIDEAQKARTRMTQADAPPPSPSAGGSR